MLDTVDANVTEYVDSDVVLGTTYYYRIIAFNSEGNSNYSSIASYTLASVVQIVADHAAVTGFDNIPAFYIEEVKKMLINVVGQSHGRAYIYGLESLQQQTGGDDSVYKVQSNWVSAPASSSVGALRVSRTYRISSSGVFSDSAGEENFWTNSAAIENIKAYLTYMRDQNNQISAFGFGWCWDMTWHNAADGGLDPIYNVQWAGSSVGGIDGDLRWGLDSDDYVLTGNSVSLMNYLQAVNDYNTIEPDTRTFFTTGPADNHAYTQEGYQRFLKHEYIRDYIATRSGAVLFDFADILSYNNIGVQNFGGWTDTTGAVHSFPVIHPDNDEEYDGGQGSCHISEQGCVRLAKALWWMLARMSGWDGSSQ